MAAQAAGPGHGGYRPVAWSGHCLDSLCIDLREKCLRMADMVLAQCLQLLMPPDQLAWERAWDGAVQSFFRPVRLQKSTGYSRICGHHREGADL